MFHHVGRIVYVRQFNTLPRLQRLSGSAKSRLVCCANDKKTQLVLTFIVFSIEAEWEK